MTTPRTIAITGSTGYVGSAILPALLREGYKVRALVRESSLNKLPQSSQLIPIIGDATNADHLAEALTGTDTLVHLTGIKRAEIKRTGKSYADIDVGSVRAAVAAMQRTGVRRIILLSAGHIGNSEYVRCKKEAERIVRDADLDWIFLRPSYIVGPGQMWPLAISPILEFCSLFPGHFGDTARRASHVSRLDLARVIEWSLAHPEAKEMVFDVPAIRMLVS